jgi:hypothetical protein
MLRYGVGLVSAGVRTPPLHVLEYNGPRGTCLGPAAVVGVASIGFLIGGVPADMLKGVPPFINLYDCEIFSPPAMFPRSRVRVLTAGSNCGIRAPGSTGGWRVWMLRSTVAASCSAGGLSPGVDAGPHITDSLRFHATCTRAQVRP